MGAPVSALQAIDSALCSIRSSCHVLVENNERLRRREIELMKESATALETVDAYREQIRQKDHMIDELRAMLSPKKQANR